MPDLGNCQLCGRDSEALELSRLLEWAKEHSLGVELCPSGSAYVEQGYHRVGRSYTSLLDALRQAKAALEATDG